MPDHVEECPRTRGLAERDALSAAFGAENEGWVWIHGRPPPEPRPWAERDRWRGRAALAEALLSRVADAYHGEGDIFSATRAVIEHLDSLPEDTTEAP